MHNASQTKVSRKRQSKSLHPARRQSKGNDSRESGGSETPVERSGTWVASHGPEVKPAWYFVTGYREGCNPNGEWIWVTTDPISDAFKAGYVGVYTTLGPIKNNCDTDIRGVI